MPKEIKNRQGKTGTQLLERRFILSASQKVTSTRKCGKCHGEINLLSVHQPRLQLLFKCDCTEIIVPNDLAEHFLSNADRKDDGFIQPYAIRSLLSRFAYKFVPVISSPDVVYFYP